MAHGMSGGDKRSQALCQELVACDLKIKSLIQDIDNESIIAEHLDSLNGEIRQLVRQYRDKLQELETAAAEQDTVTQTQLVTREHVDLKKQLASTQASLRRANVRAASAVEKRQKQELLTPGAGGGGSEATQAEGGGLRQRSNKASVTRASSEVTQQLRSVANLLQTQVETGQHTLSTLVQSSATVDQTKGEMKNMGGHIDNASHLLKKYSRREFTDKVLIFLALVFFFSCVLYIVKQRMF